MDGHTPRHILAALVLVWGMACADAASADVAQRIDAVLDGKAAQPMKVGVHVTLMPSGKVLYSRLADELFIPASNVKLVTTASALRHLTPEFVFRTLFWADGQMLEGGVLKGDLVIQGDGDPNLSGRFYNDDVSHLPRTWAAILRKRGFRHITGDLVADDTLFDREYVCSSWPKSQLHKWYGAPIAGLGFNDNCLEIVISSSRNGQPALLRLEPDTHYCHVTNELVCTSSSKLARQRGLYLSRQLGTNDVILRGAWYVGRPPERFYVTVHEPPLYFATVLAEEMRRAGITVGGKVRLAAPGRPRVTGGDPRVHILHASSLHDTLKVMNKHSQSFYAEQVLKRTGAACFGTGTFDSGIKAAAAYLAGVGIKPGTYRMADGGGLSRDSRFTPAQLTTVLKDSYNAGYGKDYVNSFSFSGIDKSMQKRLAEPAYRGKVAAKTGTLDGVVTLSGFVFNRQGPVLAFSILVNNSNNNWAARAFTDDILRILVDEKIE